MLRFNGEKPYLESTISRNDPKIRRAKRIGFEGFVRDIHSESFTSGWKVKLTESSICGLWSEMGNGRTFSVSEA